MKKKWTFIEIATFADVSMEHLLDCHLSTNKGNKNKFREKFIFLINLIIRGCNASKEHKMQLNSTRLRKVLNDDYKSMLDTLCDLGLIIRNDYYVIEEKSKEVELSNHNICYSKYYSQKVIGYADKYHALLKEDKKRPRYKTIIENKDGELTINLVEKNIERKTLFDYYKKSLNKTKLKYDKKYCYQYIDNHFPDDNIYDKECIKRYNNETKIQYSTDENGRIYHFFTNLPKRLKPLFNLKFSVDISNSHPLILSYYLILKYSISYSLLSILYNIKYNQRGGHPLPPHYVSQLLSKNIDLQRLATETPIPMDVLKYIFVCSKGLIWDDLASSSGHTRDEVKVEAFKQIFYNEYDIAKNTEIGNLFVNEYPNVYRTVCELKDSCTNLPNKIMSLEAQIMCEVMMECYQKGWDVIHIHDDIVVVDTKTNKDVNPIDIRRIINDVFRKYLLHPSTKVKTFADEKSKEKAQEEEKLQEKKVKGIIGAVIGDIVGSRFEFYRMKGDKIPAHYKLFASTSSITDDTVLTMAVADALQHKKKFSDTFWAWAKRYPHAGFGHSFKTWLRRRKENENATNDSQGNGCGMRVSPVGFYAESLEETLELARQSAIISHNSEEGIRGAQSIAAATYMAKEQKPKDEIKKYIENSFGYNLDLTDEDIETKVAGLTQKGGRELAENTCPLAIIAFLVSDDYESAIRKAISYGCDTDTVACMAGGIASAYYGVPQSIIEEAQEYLPQEFIDVINEFDGIDLRNTRTTPKDCHRWGDIIVYGSGENKNGETEAFTAIRYFGAGKVLEGMEKRAYAIPTVGKTLDEIKGGVDRFIAYAAANPDKTFLVSRVGCSKAGYTPKDIAPMFRGAKTMTNVYLPMEFKEK